MNPTTTPSVSEPSKDDSRNPVVETVAEIVEGVTDIADVAELGCDVLSCLDGLPDCAPIDCDLGCP